jgi:lipopolysaccharide transport system ATP-binding protein
MDSLIVEGLGKRYFVASKRALAETPKRTLNLGVTRVPLPRLSLPGRVMQGRDLWALRNVSFSVAPGTILGILGANGAGKSTLLKIIARVTRPTEGRIIGTGRVVSLLELGAGFNDDFSAEDNILMNGAMHGIPRREVLERLPEIIRFAELEDFVDNPVRQYSSGMYLRLAFSVAISMQPDILLADEILAVGDMAFQERCLARVAQEAERGLTVLFVSHDMAALSRLCQRVIWLDKGEVVRDGDPETVVAEYEEAALRGKGREAGYGEKTGRHTNILAEIASVRLLNALGEEVGAAPAAEDVYVRIRLKIRKPEVAIRGVADVFAKRFLLFHAEQQQEFVVPKRGVVDLLLRIPAPLLAETTYSVTVTVYTTLGKEMKVVLDNALTFMAYGEKTAGHLRRGLIAPPVEWTVQSHVRARKKPKAVV